MDEAKVREILRNIARFKEIITTAHCRKRMDERNVTMEDILNVIMWGRVEKLAALAEDGCWECRLKGEDLDGERLIFCTIFSERENYILCKTVF